MMNFSKENLRGSSLKKHEEGHNSGSISGPRDSNTSNQQINALQKDISRGRLRPNDLSTNSQNINIKNEAQSLTKMGDHVNSSSSIKTIEPINPPLNSYKEFANVFNVKGMMHGSKSRKHAKFQSENQSITNISTEMNQNLVAGRL